MVYFQEKDSFPHAGHAWWLLTSGEPQPHIFPSTPWFCGGFDYKDTANGNDLMRSAYLYWNSQKGTLIKCLIQPGYKSDQQNKATKTLKWMGMM